MIGYLEEEGVIKNLKLEKVKIAGNEQVGSVAGHSKGFISDCTLSDVTASGVKYVGGIVGIGYDTTIVNSVVSNVTITGEEYVGGVVGTMRDEGGMVGCSLTGESSSVSGHTSVGGLGGDLDGGVFNCSVSNVTVSGHEEVGGVVGKCPISIGCQASNVTIIGLEDEEDDYHEEDVSSRYLGCLAGAIEDSLASCHVWDSSVSGNGEYSIYIGGLVGRAEKSIHDCTVTNVKASGNAYIGGVAGRIEENVYDCTVSTIDITTIGEEITHIGGLVGVIDESVFNCSAMNVTTSGDEYIGGLAGEIEGDASDCTASNVTVSGDEFIGGLTGRVVDNAYSCKVADITASGNKYIGGLAGEIEGDASDCTASHVTVSGTESISGLAGCVEGKYYIINSSVSNNSTVTGDKYVGGLTGRSSSNNIIGCSVSGTSVSGNQYVGGLIGTGRNYCYIFGCNVWDVTVTGTGENNNRVGGVAGSNKGYIVGCYVIGGTNSTSGESGISGISEVGGLVGFCDEGDVIGSYAISTVNGTSMVGGIVGYKDMDPGNITGCYWSGNATGGIGEGQSTTYQTVKVDDFTLWNTTVLSGLNSAVTTWNTTSTDKQCLWEFITNTGSDPTLDPAKIPLLLQSKNN